MKSVEKGPWLFVSVFSPWMRSTFPKTAFQPAGDEVFVYGREVDDFRAVDYDSLTMLNISATQELSRARR